MTIAENDSEIIKKINECYLQVLGRPVMPDGLYANLQKIKKENLTIEQLHSQLKKSKIRKSRLDFLRKISSPLRILPDFLIIGGNKCGTTSLFKYMIEHPCILAPTNKEINYFNRFYENGTMWYRSHYPTFLSKLYYKMKTKTKIITGEATTHYLTKEPKTPYRVKKLVPSIKLIVILRNPIDRAYSQYNMLAIQQREPLSFEKAIAFAMQNPNQTDKKLILAENLNMTNDYSYLRRGIYVDDLKRWMNIFPKERFLILQTEEFNSKPNEVLNRIYKFLGLPTWINKVHQKYNVGKYEKMNSETRSMLVEYFKPHNKRLNELLETNFDWDC